MQYYPYKFGHINLSYWVLHNARISYCIVYHSRATCMSIRYRIYDHSICEKQDQRFFSVFSSWRVANKTSAISEVHTQTGVWCSQHVAHECYHTADRAMVRTQEPPTHHVLQAMASFTGQFPGFSSVLNQPWVLAGDWDNIDTCNAQIVWGGWRLGLQRCGATWGKMGDWFIDHTHCLWWPAGVLLAVLLGTHTLCRYFTLQQPLYHTPMINNKYLLNTLTLGPDPMQFSSHVLGERFSKGFKLHLPIQ